MQYFLLPVLSPYIYFHLTYIDNNKLLNYMGDGFCKSKTNLIGFCLLKCIREFKEYVNVWLGHLGISIV